MLKITVIRKTEYENHPVYILQFDTAFQYLFIHGGEIYQDYALIRPPLWKLALYRLGIINSDKLYTKEELEQYSEIMLSGAVCSIDKLREQERRT